MLYERSIIVAKNAVRADVIETPLEYISKSKASILIQSNNTSFELPAIRVCIAVRWLFLQWTTKCYDRLTFNDTASRAYNFSRSENEGAEKKRKIG